MGNTSTIFPALVEVQHARNIPLLNAFTTYMDFVSGFKNELVTYLGYNEIQYSSDFVTANKTFFDDLDTRKTNYDIEFLAYYVRQYEKAVSAVKEEIQKLNKKNSLYSGMSDSIGILTNTMCLLTDSVVPLNDLDATIYTIAQPYPTSIVNKISPNVKALTSQMNQSITSLYRHNIINIQFVYANSTESHGSNLITDLNAYIRMRDIVPPLISKLITDFDKLFGVVTYYSNLHDHGGYNPQDPTLNLQSIPRIKFSETIEGVKVDLDLLGKRIVAARKDITLMQRLDVAAVPLSVATQTQASSTHSGATPTQIISQSTKPTPLNSTATSKVKITNQKLPEPVAKTKEQEEKIKQSVQKVADVKKKASKIDVSKPSDLLKKIPIKLPEFPRLPFALSKKSPIASLSAIKDFICTFKIPKISLSALGSISLPKLPDFFKNFKFKNPFTGLAMKVQMMLIKKLLSLIPPLPKIPDFKKLFMEFAKKLFLCNPGNKK